MILTHWLKNNLDFKNRIERKLGIKVLYILFSALEHMEIIEKIVILIRLSLVMTSMVLLWIG